MDTYEYHIPLNATKKWIKAILTLTLLFYATTAFAQVTTKGKDFWLGFTENEFVRGLTLEIYITSDEPATVLLTNPLGTFRNTKEVVPGQVTLVILPNELMHRGEGKNDFGVHITSDEDISVFALNKRIISADATVILPTEALDTEYYVMAHAKQDTIDNDAKESNLLIVATQDNTEIEIVPSVDTFKGLKAGVTENFILQAGETYYVQSSDDLTGTFVRSVVGADRICKKIAVFGGNKLTNVGSCGATRDHLMAQMYPISYWGEEFLFVPFSSRKGGDFVKILASEDGTRVQISGEGTIELDAGEFYVNESLEGVRSIKSNEPISIGQFSRSQGCDEVSSDPFMLIMNPIGQGVKSVNFTALPTLRSLEHHLTLVTSSANLSNIQLDGVDITDQFRIVGDAAYATLSYSIGNHRLTAENGVIPYVYAFGEEESFGYVAAATLGDDDLIQVAESLTIIPDSESVCAGTPSSFLADFLVIEGEEPLFDTFEWDFGDGNTGFGKEVIHTFEAAGSYEVVLRASDGRSVCNTIATAILEIEVKDLAIREFLGPLSVCPNTTGIEYVIDGPDGNTYDWSISGGTITSGGNSNKITVDWGEENNNAYIRVVPLNTDQCNVEPLTFDIRVNLQLTPAPPSSNGFSDSEVCFDQVQSVIYSVNPTNGSQYEWFVDGHGEILGSNQGENIEVRWKGPGKGQVWYREHNPSIADCQGFSEVLNVTIYEEIQASASISDALCNGEDNGSIELFISGGKPGNYDVNWSNGMQRNQITGLSAGTYVATITDELGCSVQRSFEVGEPLSLVIRDMEVTSALCFQEASGKVFFMVDGGTPFPNGDYRYQLTSRGTTISSDSRLIESLKGGDYEVTVTDANGCEATTSLTVGEPSLLEADLNTLINESICPQASNGRLFVDAKGGVPDYQFFWSSNNGVEGQEVSDLSMGGYSVRIVDANGCEATFSTVVAERFPKISVPNAFSPNDDGTNDVFKPVTDCNLPFSVQVYNQWGAVVFSSQDINQGWDGNFEGEKAPDGKYSYIIFYTVTLNGRTYEESYRGTVKLIR